MNSSSLLFAVILLVSGAPLSFSETHQPSASNKTRTVQTQASASHLGFFKGRWTEDGFEYQDEKDNWIEAKAAYRATENGTLLDIDGNTVEYSKGDILFKAQNDGWYKARKERPQSAAPAVPVAPVVPDDPAVPNPKKVELSETERLVIKYTNEERMKRGLPALQVASSLLNLSRQKSANMARLRNMSHSVSPQPNGGENIAWNQANAREVVRTWMNSDGHRANILSRRYSTIGVAVATGDGPYWTQMFQ
ncbi:MAG: CAP domain-containing protein [Pseudomonadota bacterium]